MVTRAHTKPADYTKSLHCTCQLYCLLYITAKFNLESVSVVMLPGYYFFNYAYRKDETEAMELSMIKVFTNELVRLLLVVFKPGGQHTWFLIITFIVGMYMCACVCTPLRP